MNISEANKQGQSTLQRANPLQSAFDMLAPSLKYEFT